MDKNKDIQKNQKISLNPKHLAIIKKGLEDATNTQGGTSFRSRIPGNLKMAGKTGTSQVRVISSQEREEDAVMSIRQMVYILTLPISF